MVCELPGYFEMFINLKLIIDKAGPLYARSNIHALGIIVEIETCE